MPRESVPGSGICSSAIASGYGSGLSGIRLDSWLDIENHKRASDITLQLATSFPLINDADKSYPWTPFFPICDGNRPWALDHVACRHPVSIDKHRRTHRRVYRFPGRYFFGSAYEEGTT